MFTRDWHRPPMSAVSYRRSASARLITRFPVMAAVRLFFVTINGRRSR